VDEDRDDYVYAKNKNWGKMKKGRGLVHRCIVHVHGFPFSIPSLPILSSTLVIFSS
jgi:hypothetical protein